MSLSEVARRFTPRLPPPPLPPAARPQTPGASTAVGNLALASAVAAEEEEEEEEEEDEEEEEEELTSEGTSWNPAPPSVDPPPPFHGPVPQQVSARHCTPAGGIGPAPRLGGVRPKARLARGEGRADAPRRPQGGRGPAARLMKLLRPAAAAARRRWMTRIHRPDRGSANPGVRDSHPLPEIGTG